MSRIASPEARIATSSRPPFFKRVKLGAKTFAGFGAVLALVIALAGFVVYETGAIGRNFDEFGEVAGDAVALNNLDAEMMTMAWQAGEFSFTWDKDTLRQAKELMASVEGMIGDISKELEAAGDDPNAQAAKAQADQMNALFNTYVTQFDVMTGQFDQITKLVDEVADPAADAGVEALRKLLKGTFEAGNFQAAAIVGQAQETFLGARIYADNYIDNSEDGAVEKVAESLAQFDGYAKQLSASLSVATNRALLEEAVVNAATFKAAFDEAAKLTAESDKILQETLLPTLDQIGDLSDKMKVAAAEEQQVNRGEVADGIGAARLTTIIVAGVAVLLGLAIAFLIVRSVASPIKGMTSAMTDLAGGNKQVEIPGQSRGDEIGAMAKAVLVFKDNMIEAERLRVEQEESKKRAEAERRQAMLDLADKFEASVGGVVESVTSAATELQATAQSLSATAEETSQQSNAVAAASEQMTQNVQTVSSATEELSSSIREIGNQVTESTRIVGTAVTQAEDTNSKVKTLAEAAQKIGDVVTLINEIAAQTNLLALNATIEAARAGEAGKGFAVVASEVKNLATQTAKATEEIAGQVRAIQEATGTSAQAIESIAQTINRVNEISTTIASAVEEQGAATQEIARNVQEASTGTAEVTNNISGVTQASQQTSAGSTQVLSAASELAKNGEKLRQEVGNFLATVRAA